MKRRVALILLTVVGTACGGGEDSSPSDGGLCPAEVADTQTWFYSGDDSRCETFANAVNSSLEKRGEDRDESGGADPCGTPMRTSMSDDGGTCRASAIFSCETVQGQLSCVIDPSGEADCNTQIDLNIRDTQLSCNFAIEFR